MKHIILSAATISILLSACASGPPAGGDRGGPPERGERSDKERGASRGPMISVSAGGIWLAGLDRNNDYAVSQSELSQGKAAAFTTADVNNDGTLTLFELDDWREKALGSTDAMPGRFVFDPDFDQQITRGEFETTLETLFVRADKDKDGLLYRSEIVRVIDRSVRGERGQAGQRGGGRGEGGGRRGG